MIPTATEQLLKEVSRSFYLSLRLLPAMMRRAAAHGYLLARASDTIADVAAPAEIRLSALDSFVAALDGNAPTAVPDALACRISHPGEVRLIELLPDLLRDLSKLPATEAALVREVVTIITGGQRFDITRFEGGGNAKVVALADDAELDDYTWRVAGCVGAFWTDLGFLTMGERFSRAEPTTLRRLGIDFGKGLQLVNILRDLPEDFARGRCYLPVADPADSAAVMQARERFLGLAATRMDEGIVYARSLESKRLRVSAALPAMIGRETIALMKDASWETLEAGVKIPRSRVYQLLLRAFAGRFG
ncbi:MAG: squalene/phytoene synthase family protein [Akkermansiaceae bacterium]|nr:squalene/phytoene synthase family protein [Akkermansiaceae bacterium]